MSVTQISKRLSNLGEGPHWDVNSQKLYYVDAFVGDICRLDPTTGETEAVTLDGTVTFVIPFESNQKQLLVSCNKEVRKLNFEEKISEVVAVVDPENLKSRFNDGKCDPKGQLWTGTLVEDQSDYGHLYRMNSSYQFEAFADKISLSNGITWSLDYKTLFYVDSLARKIYSFDFDLDAATAKNKQVLVDYNKDEGYSELGFPDGMTTDEEGKLWIACFDGSCILQIDPKSGHILKKVMIPATKVTSCCFGGPSLDVLYVTTAASDLSSANEEKYPQAGAVFAVTNTGAKGRPLFNFAN